MRQPDRLAALLFLALALAALPGFAKEKAPPATKHVSYIGQVNLRLAMNYLREGDLQLALEKGNHALRSDPQSSQVHTTLAMIHERIGDQAKAGKHYDRALSLEPGNGSVLNAHAVFLCRRGDRATADAEFNRALADPFYTQPKQALLNAGRCAMQGEDLGKADGYFRRVVQDNPKDKTALMALASLGIL